MAGCRKMTGHIIFAWCYLPLFCGLLVAWRQGCVRACPQAVQDGSLCLEACTFLLCEGRRGFTAVGTVGTCVLDACPLRC